MLRTQMLVKNYEFERVFRRGRFYSSRVLTLYVRPRQDRDLRLGITVAKQVKGSVKRNRVKRWLREVYRLTEGNLQPGYDLIMFARLKPEETSYQEILKAWTRLIKKAKIDLSQVDGNLVQDSGA